MRARSIARIIGGLFPHPLVNFSDAVRAVAGGSEIDVMVSPNAKKCSIGDVDQWRKRLIIKVTAPPEGGRANKEVEELLTETFGSKAVIVVGHTTRMKTVMVQRDKAAVVSRLEGTK